MMYWKYIVTALVAFIAGLVVYDVFLVDLYLESKANDSTTYVQCPTEDNFNEVWNRWSYDYINQNPNATTDEQMGSWNNLMIQNGCDKKWLNPLSDLIGQRHASGTPVYWYTE